jgi:hypothetical protein
MPTPTYTPLATVTLGSTTSSVTFSSIPATYRDLILITNGKATGGDDYVIYFNGDTTTGNYSRVLMNGNGSTTASFSGSGSNPAAIYDTDGVFVHQIMDYSATDKHKTYLARSNTAGVVVIAGAARWANTAAITSVLAKPASASFASGTTLSLYGVIA